MTGSRISVTWFAAACVLTAELAQVFLAPLGPGTLATVWLSTGLLVSALILSAAPGWRTLPPISLAVTFLSMVFHGHPVVSAAVLSTIATADACVTALLVRRRVAGSFTTH